MPVPLPCRTVKTRNLLLLALGCGLAIMLAGAVFFFRLATQDEPEPPIPTGEQVQVGDMSVTVHGIDEASGVLRVDITIGGTQDDDPTDGFRLIASARPIQLAATTCGPSTADREDCSLEFDVGGVDGVSRVLFYERGDEQARWVLA